MNEDPLVYSIPVHNPAVAQGTHLRAERSRPSRGKLQVDGPGWSTAHPKPEGELSWWGIPRGNSFINPFN